jgi:hypothetical protein
MPAPNPFANIEKYHPNAQAAFRESYAQIADAANRMGISPENYIERDKMLKAQEDQDRKDAMDPNKSKFMSKEERSQKLNAYKNRRFLELGIGHIPGEG